MNERTIELALDRLVMFEDVSEFAKAYAALGKLRDLRNQQQVLSEELRQSIYSVMNGMLQEAKGKFTVPVDAEINEADILTLKFGAYDLKVTPDFGLRIWNVTGSLADKFQKEHGELPLTQNIAESLADFFNRRYDWFAKGREGSLVNKAEER